MDKQTTESLLRVVAPHFVGGLVLRGDTVMRAAVILNYMIGWPIAKVRRYCETKRWALELVTLAVGPDWRAFPWHGL